MSLIFHGHPLSSFCWKALIALYENETPFTWQLVDLGDPASRAAFAALWPIAKMPVLVEDARGAIVAEASIIVEYLDQHYPGQRRFIPEDPDQARETRFWDRVCDNYLQLPMQKIVLDRLRPEDERDPHGVGEARGLLATALHLIERHMHGKAWLTGENVSMADCAAAPGLYYADKVIPLLGTYPMLALFLERLKGWPSFARVLDEAGPYFQYFPEE